MSSQEVKRITPETERRLKLLARETTGLELLVLFGSRGRGDVRDSSDWDFAFRGNEELDTPNLMGDLTATLSTDDVDLVDLERAGGLLRYTIARDGVPIYEAKSRAFEQFWLDAVSFWCDAQHVLEPEYESILERLSR